MVWNQWSSNSVHIEQQRCLKVRCSTESWLLTFLWFSSETVFVCDNNIFTGTDTTVPICWMDVTWTKKTYRSNVSDHRYSASLYFVVIWVNCCNRHILPFIVQLLFCFPYEINSYLREVVLITDKKVVNDGYERCVPMSTGVYKLCSEQTSSVTVYFIAVTVVRRLSVVNRSQRPWQNGPMHFQTWFKFLCLIFFFCDVKFTDVTT